MNEPEERPTIYIAGRYRAPTEYEVHENIEAARTAGVALLRAGWWPIIPHLASAYLGGVVDDEIVLRSYLMLIRRAADALYMLEGWHRSEGAKREYDLATKLDIPIYLQESNSPPPQCSQSRVRTWL
jgi:hypothetical protein